MPYRVPAEIVDPQDDPPGSWRKPSARVLGALARLSEARGAVDTSEALTERARHARPEPEPTPKKEQPIPSCRRGRRALAEADFTTALSEYRTWLGDAAGAPARRSDLVEACAALAWLERRQGFVSAADDALRNALYHGATRLPDGLAARAFTTLVDALLRLQRIDDAARVATHTASEAPLDVAARQQMFAEILLADGELEGAAVHLGHALSIRSELLHVDDAEHATTRLALARLQHRSGKLAAAETTFSLAIDSCERARDVVLEADAHAHAAELLADTGRLEGALDFAEIGQLRVRPVRSLWAVVPLAVRARLLRRANLPMPALKIEHEEQAIRASYAEGGT